MESAEAVRESVLAQHEALRPVLRDLAATAQDAERGDAAASAAVGDACARLRTDFERHLAFEEQHLIPALRASDPYGGERARVVLEEHARQRQELATLVDLSTTEHDARTVALALQSFIADIVQDMRHEERDLLGPEALRDDPLVADQASD